ncbi:MAG TPA: iron-sulfur cluster assembly protein, partial [Thermoanaerobaculia bacterium]|nr:iron-sulfur cluster assembly protein [Thermoanaerobaculia bacterium]
MSSSPGEQSKNPVKLDPAAAEAPPAEDDAALEDRIVRTLKSIYDPEIPVDIYELGLIYDIDVQSLPTGERSVHVKMTLTSPACPVAGSL